MKGDFVYKALLVCLLAAGLLAQPAGALADDHFGAPFGDARVVNLAEVVDRPESFAGQAVRIEGKIADVCQEKGCWLVITDGKRQMRVSFKDYAFFVPKDSAGRGVVVEGTVIKKTITEFAARHYAEESGHKEDAAKISGPQVVVVMTATSVLIKAQE
jgi:hypothetical protein